MFEAREFLRKKLIGKKVSDEHAFVNVWTWSYALGVIILNEVLSRLFSSRWYSWPSLVELLWYEERCVYVSGSGTLWEMFKIGALTIVWLSVLSRQVPGSIPVSIIAYCPMLHSSGSSILSSHLHCKYGTMGVSSEGKLLPFFFFWCFFYFWGARWLQEREVMFSSVTNMCREMDCTLIPPSLWNFQ